MIVENVRVFPSSCWLFCAVWRSPRRWRAAGSQTWSSVRLRDSLKTRSSDQSPSWTLEVRKQRTTTGLLVKAAQWWSPWKRLRAKTWASVVCRRFVCWDSRREDSEAGWSKNPHADKTGETSLWWVDLNPVSFPEGPEETGTGTSRLDTSGFSSGKMWLKTRSITGQISLKHFDPLNNELFRDRRVRSEL